MCLPSAGPPPLGGGPKKSGCLGTAGTPLPPPRVLKRSLGWTYHLKLASEVPVNILELSGTGILQAKKLLEDRNARDTLRPTAFYLAKPAGAGCQYADQGQSGMHETFSDSVWGF